MALRRNLHISGLDIAVNDGGLARSQVSEGIANCRSDQNHFFFRDQPHSIHALAQVFALNIIHHQVLTLVVNYKVIGDTGQVRMAQVRQDDRFAPELPGVLLGCEEVILNGNFNAQILIDRPVNRSHPALPEDLNNPVTVIEKRPTFQIS